MSSVTKLINVIKKVRVSCSFNPPEGKQPCKWRVNGSILYDGKTVQVKNEPKMHTCPGTQRDGKAKVAKRKWIVAKVTNVGKRSNFKKNPAITQDLSHLRS